MDIDDVRLLHRQDLLAAGFADSDTEKLRADAMRDEDLRAVRWGWPDIDPFDSATERLRRAFRAA